MFPGGRSETPQRQQKLYDPYPTANQGLSPGSGSKFEPVTYPPDIHDVEKGREVFVRLVRIHDNGTQSPGSRNRSLDLSAGTKKYQYLGVDSSSPGDAASPNEDPPLDPPPDKLTQLYNYLLNFSFVTRWTLLILPLLWIPGILSLTAFPHAVIWAVKLIWWSIWLSVVWVGWWAALALARFLPEVARYTVGAVAVTTRRYIDWLSVLHRYIATFLWSLVICIAWQPLIIARQQSGASAVSKGAVNIIARTLFGIFVLAAILLGEKFSIQWIAGKFHERSYAERIADQQKAMHILVTLYQHFKENPDPDASPSDKVAKFSVGPTHKKAQRGVKKDFQTTAALEDLANEIATSPVLQPDTPQAKVVIALGSANGTRLFARRLYYSFVKPGAQALEPSDIAKFFPTKDEADDAFLLLDKDGNGDVTLDEVEMACMDCHREQLSIANSMKDTGTAVGRLDSILMSLYSVVVVIVIAIVLDSQVTTLLAGVGTLVLGLSWLIGGSLAEILTSIIFLFVKHPYDVGDRVNIGGESYVVKEIMLLSTIFLDQNNAAVQAPHNMLSSQLILNMRRSPTMSETFAFDVAFDTTFEQIETLRDKMLTFVKQESRDFLPNFDVTVVDIPEQAKMSLTADIKYKSNWQQDVLKAQRRNKWVCALKESMANVGIYGPAGKPSAISDSKPFTFFASNAKKQEAEMGQRESGAPLGNYRLADRKAVILDDSRDVFGEAEQLAMSTPHPTMPRPRPNIRPSGAR